MNVEELRNYCLSLGTDIEERMPFQAFKAARGVLAFYVGGHMFCYFDVDSFAVINVKCQPELIPQLKEQHDSVRNPYNMSAKHWIGIDPSLASNELVRQLVSNSYNLVRSAAKPTSTKTKSKNL